MPEVRPIDANALKTKLKICTNTATYSDYCNGYCDARQVDLDAIDAAPTINRWIPCSERLPEVDTMVIVCYYGSDCIFPMQGETVTEAIARQNKVTTVTIGFLSEEGWNGADMFPMMVQPTFWMPLPEPPEKEDNNGDRV